MTIEITYNPRVYVGTYGKYNEGSLAGKWVDLTEFDDKADFIEYCLELHKDEDDPELMFQDFDNIPKAFYSECGICEKLWEYMDLDDDDREILDAFVKCFGFSLDESLDRYRDAYEGEFDTFREFAKQTFDETNEIPDHLISYIDYDAVERDYGFEFVEHNGHVFRRNW